MSLLQVVVGGQAGSEGKGAIAAYLASKHRNNGLSLRVAGPNAGHTVIGRCPPDCEAAMVHPVQTAGHDLHRHPWRLRQVPVAAVSNPKCELGIAQGSEIDPEVLAEEVRQLDLAGYNVSDRLFVDRSATVIETLHKDQESNHYGDGLPDRIGSTGKGIGAARAARAMRRAGLAGSFSRDLPVPVVQSVSTYARDHLRDGGEVLIEGTQGYLLGTHAGYYPQCTSSDCTAVDFLSMAGLSPWQVRPGELEVWVVFRTYPIRVAGNSGPLKNETSWEALGLEPELTTVTRKVRRVGQWDAAAARQAMSANGHDGLPYSPVHVALTMADYLIPELSGVTSSDGIPEEKREDLDLLIARHSRDLGKLVDLIGTGPGSVLDIRGMAADLLARRMTKMGDH